MENENLDELLAEYEKAIKAAIADGSDEAIKEASILDEEYERLKARKASIEAAQKPSEIDDVIKSLPKAGAGAGAALDFVANILPYAQEVGIEGAIQIMKLLGMDGKKLENNKKVMKDFARLFGPAGILPNKENMPSVRQIFSDLTGGATEYEPQTVPGEYAGTLAEFAGGAAALPIGGPVRSITSSILPALGSETAGQTARKYAPEYEQLARFAAALGTPAVTAPATQSISRRMTLGPADEIYGNVPGSQRAENVDLLKQMGMRDISAGQQIWDPLLYKS